MMPLNHSGQTPLPPIRSGLVDVRAVPASALLETCAPLTYMRMSRPSHVMARCDQVLSGSADGPSSARSSVVNTCPLGRDAVSVPA